MGGTTSHICNDVAGPCRCTTSPDCAVANQPFLLEQHRLPQTRACMALCAALPRSPTEMQEMILEHHQFPTSAIEARLISPSTNDLEIYRTPQRVYADRPFEIELAAAGCIWDGSIAVSVAHCMSTHGYISLEILCRSSCASLLVPLSVRPSGGRWIARALIRPASWADATSVNVLSMSFAWRPMPCDCLPMTLLGRFNHAPAPVGAVYLAAGAGDVVALQAALDSGGSTEEMDEVR